MEINHNERESRYELLADGNIVGTAAYRIDGTVLTATETSVADAFGGHGYAGELVTRMLDDARAAGLTVRPQCSYVAHFIDTHEDYQDLLAK